MNRSSILITGATGFVGSALAARFLADGQSLLCLSRNDESGERTRSAIQGAASGMSLQLKEDWRKRVRVVPSRIDPALFGGTSAVWNCAAEMGYSFKNLPQSLKQNVEFSVELFQAVAKGAPAGARFFQISTAYTGAPTADAIPERLHSGSPFWNAYQTSKWCAEHALSTAASQQTSLPLTILRPGIVVGDSRSGWSPAKAFGLYQFCDWTQAAKDAGASSLPLDMNPEIRPALVCIDEFIEAALAVSTRSPAAQYVHLTGGHPWTYGEIGAVMAREYGFPVLFVPQSQPGTDPAADRMALNLVFARANWKFDQTTLLSVVAESPWRSRGLDVLERIVRQFKLARSASKI